MHIVADRPREFTEAIEILVHTTGEFPIRALSPVLFIGDVKIAHYEREGENTYRFYAYNPDELKEGAPISLGWPFSSNRATPTNFRYEIGESVAK